MAVRIALFATVVASCCNAATAADVGGRYRMKGTSTTGAAYTGAVEIVMISNNSCRITYSDGFAGICLMKGTTLAVSCIVHSKAGLFIYEICSDGSLQGDNIDDFHGGGIGKGMLVPDQ